MTAERQLQTTAQNPYDLMLTRLSTPSAKRIIKAQNILGNELRDVTAYSKVYASQDMAVLIDDLDADAAPASETEATVLSAILMGKCRANAMPNGPMSANDFKVNAKGLAEAFAPFPTAIGLQAIDGGTGVPAQTPFWPKPQDVVKFCQALMQKRANAKVMAQRHLAEAKRRELELAEKKNADPIDYAARARRAAEILGEFA